DADPLRPGRAPRLLAQARQGLGERAEAVPAQLEVVVEAAADGMDVRIVETGDDRAPAEIDDLGPGPGAGEHVALVADGREASILDGDRLGGRQMRVAGRKATVLEDELGHLQLALISVASCAAGTWYSGRRVAGAPWTMV